MRDTMEQRACDLAVYIIENRATVRAAAKQFGVSKSTVHKDCTERLQRFHPELAEEVRQVLEVNKQERHIRGGMATKEKYSHMHESLLDSKEQKARNLGKINKQKEKNNE